MPEKATSRCKGSAELCWNSILRLVCIYLEIVPENKSDSQVLHAMTGSARGPALELVHTNATGVFNTTDFIDLVWATITFAPFRWR
jgi:hypothetical protein